MLCLSQYYLIANPDTIQKRTGVKIRRNKLEKSFFVEPGLCFKCTWARLLLYCHVVQSQKAVSAYFTIKQILISALQSSVAHGCFVNSH